MRISNKVDDDNFRTFPLYFGTPTQRNEDGIPMAQFSIDTRISPLFVDSTPCNEIRCPAYEIEKSVTASFKQTL